MENLVISKRGDIVENRHIVHAVILDATGRILFTLGDPHRVTIIRSSAKPAQALAILKTDAFDRYDFDDADLALMCASHNSEPRHVARVQAILDKIGCDETDLQCGGHLSLLASVNEAWAAEKHAPTQINNNCSGKHSGLLAGARSLGADVKGYETLHHPIQQQVQRAVEELTGHGPEELQWVVDGCNLPVPAMPLSSLATMYANLAVAPTLQSTDGILPSDHRHVTRIYDAMTQYPEMVAGETRFCTALMEAYKGALIGKIGADGCYGIGIRPSSQTKALGATGSIGIAVKIEDGNIDITYCAIVEILEQLGLVTPEIQTALAAFHHIERKNTMNVVVGTSVPVFRLEPFPQKT